MALWLFANAGILGAHGTYPGPGGVGGNTPEASTEVTGAASKAVIACSYLFVASYAPTWGPVRVTDGFLSAKQWLTFDLGLLDLPFGDLPQPRSWQGHGSCDFCKLGFQLRSWLLRPSCLHQHQMAHLHCLRCLLRRNVAPRLLVLP